MAAALLKKKIWSSLTSGCSALKRPTDITVMARNLLGYRGGSGQLLICRSVPFRFSLQISNACAATVRLRAALHNGGLLGSTTHMGGFSSLKFIAHGVVRGEGTGQESQLAGSS